MTKQRVRNLLQNLNNTFPKGSFAHNLAITFSGNATALVLGLIFTPFIVRLYGPPAYGAFALFAAVLNNLSPLATLQYPTGYAAIRKPEEFYGVVQLTLAVIITLTLAVSIVIYFFDKPLLEYFHLSALAPYVWFFPFYFLFTGLDLLTRGWNIRLAEFKRSAAGRVGATLASKITTLLFGYFVRADAMGIMLGDLLQYPFDIAARISNMMRTQFRQAFNQMYFRKIPELFKTYSVYPKYITSGLLLSNFSNQLPVYVLSYFYGQSTLGLFALAMSLVSMPMNVLMMSSTTVFLQKASELYHERPAELGSAVLRLYRELTRYSTWLLLVLALVAQPVFVFLFGTAWSESGVYAAWLALSFVPAVTAQPLSALFRVMNRERINFMLHVASISIRTLALVGGTMLGGARSTVLLYSVSSVIVYYLILWIIFSMCRLSKKQLLRDAFVTLLLIAGVVTFYNFAF